MKRNLDLCREILQRLEDRSELYSSLPEIEGLSKDEVFYHANLLSEAGLLWSIIRPQHPDGEAFRAEGTKAGLYAGTRDRYRLTWAGHEFLDVARNDTLWHEAKHEVGSRLGALPFELVRAVLVDLSKKLVGLR